MNRWVTKIACLFCLYANADDSFEYEFHRLFPNPKTLIDEQLFRFKEQGNQKNKVFLNNLSDVRDVVSDSGDRHWKTIPANIFRAAYFGQPKSGEFHEYWIQTVERPSRKKGDVPSNFTQDSVMSIPSLLRLSLDRVSNDALGVQLMSLEEGYYLRCIEDLSVPAQKSSKKRHPLNCFYVDNTFCASSLAGGSAEAQKQILERSSNEARGKVSAILEEQLFKYWGDVDQLFSGGDSGSPGISHHFEINDFTPTILMEAEIACRIFQRSERVESANQHKREK